MFNLKTPRREPLIRASLCLGLILTVGLIACCLFDAGDIFGGGAVLAMAAPVAFGLGDAQLSVSKALSNGAGAVTSDPIDLGEDGSGKFVAGCEVLITAPALTTTLLPDDETMTYDVLTDADVAAGSPTVIHNAAILQTGAGGAGAAAAEIRVRLPTNVERYIFLKVTKTGTGNASTVSGTMALKV